MKNKLLHSFRLRATMLVAMMLCVVNAAWADEVTFNFPTIASNESWVNGTAYTSYTITPITVNALGGGNNGKYYTSSNGSWRMYSGGTVEITAAEGYTITEVSSNPVAEFTIANGTATFSPSARTDFKTITVTYTTSGGGGSQTETVATPTFSPAAGTYTSAQNVEISTTTTGATIYYTTDGSTPSDQSTPYTSAITVDETMTLKAIAVATGMDNSAVATATYTIVNIEHAGTEQDPYNVADARAAIDANTGMTDVYVSGIVSQVDSYNSTYHSITYWISEDGTTTNQFEVYSGKGINGANFSSVNDIQVGDIVVVNGDIKKYNSTYEFSQNSQLVSLDRPGGTKQTVTLDFGSSSVTHDLSDSFTGLSLSVDPEGLSVTYSSSDESVATVNPTTGVVTMVGAGTTTITATFTETDEYYGATDSYTLTVTNNNAAATLPFAYDGNGTSLPDGLTQNGLGTYNSSPKMKFDGTGDYLILKINERPGVLTFDIKGNPSSGSWSGTFKVQTSEDGTNYTDLATYTDLTSTLQQKEFDNLGENVRYIKWIYTSKSSGNVALGNIILAEYVAPSNSAPVWSELPTPSVNVNVAYDLNLSDYVSGTPTPTIGLNTSVDNSLYEFEDGYLVFQPTEAGIYEFTFTATNSEGSSNATLTVTATAVTPATGDDYELFSGDLVEGDYIIYYEGKAMNTTVTSDRLQYAEVTPENNVITTNDAAIVWHIAQSGDYWTIYNADADAYAASTGAKNKAQMLADGTDDKALWTVSGTETYEFVNKQNTTNNVNANLRNNDTYGFACYATGTGRALSLYKKVETTPATESVTITSALYAAIVTKNNVSFYNSGVTAYIVTATDTDEATLTAVDEAPAGTPLIVKAEAAGTYDLTVKDVVTKDVTGNLLQASNGSVTGDGSTIFALGNKDGVGFYVVGDGVTVPAGKPYLVISEDTGVKGFLAFNFGTATAISGLDAQKAERGTMYNLAGQRVNKAVKGIFIQNGKKIVVR